MVLLTMEDVTNHGSAGLVVILLLVVLLLPIPIATNRNNCEGERGGKGKHNDVIGAQVANQSVFKGEKRGGMFYPLDLSRARRIA